MDIALEKNLFRPQPQPPDQPSFSGYLFGFLYGLIVTVITATAGILAAHLIIVVCPIITNILIFATTTTIIKVSIIAITLILDSALPRLLRSEAPSHF